MDDRKLLERAARAGGVPGVYVEVHGPDIGQDAVGIGRPDARYGDPLWNSLEDDGDALRLAVKLRIPLWFDTDTSVIAGQRNCGDAGWRVETGINDMGGRTAARRAITRAAVAQMEARNANR
jgi:hypothetical protein